jgi:ABC-type branched-subunit amino acid transport system substrate-binding protein
MRLRDGGSVIAQAVFLLACLASLLLPTPATASRQLDAARRAFEYGRYEEAYAAAQPILESSRSAEGREARLIAAEALIELGRFSEAITVLAPLLGDRPPGPSDAPWVRLLARSLQGQGLLLEAADWWLTFARFGRDAEREGRQNIRRLLRGGLSQAEIAYLFWKYPRHELLCQAAPDYVSGERERGHANEAHRAWLAAQETCDETAGPAPPVPEKTLGAPAGLSDFFTIGVLAPLNGLYARYGIALANGADVARRLHNARARYPLRLEIADTRGTPQGCLDAVQRLYGRGIRIFIGEIFSLHTLMTAAYLHDRDAILLSPAATDTSIGQLGPGVYTSVVGSFEQASALVAYAVDSLSVRNAALLWPQHPEGERWARLFGRLLRARGGRVTLDRAYPPGTTDFGDLCEENGGPLPGAIEGIFCPGGMRELVALLSQLAHAGFLGPYIGGPPMGDELVSQVVNEFGLTTLYPGDTYVAMHPGGEAAGFEETYLRLFGMGPDEFAHRGWTAFGLLGAAVEAGGYCCEALEEVLEASAAAARARGEGRKPAVPEAVSASAIYLRWGDQVNLVGRGGPQGEAAASDTTAAPPDSVSARPVENAPVGTFEEIPPDER